MRVGHQDSLPNAPARPSAEGDGTGPIIVVKPPHFLIQLGLLEPNYGWRVRRALYGLQTSPRDWAVYGDKELRSLEFSTPEPSTLCQSQTDDSTWLVRTGKGLLLGVMIVYVDDIAVFGPRELLNGLCKPLWQSEKPRNLLGPHQPSQ